MNKTSRKKRKRRKARVKGRERVNKRNRRKIKINNRKKTTNRTMLPIPTIIKRYSNNFNFCDHSINDINSIYLNVIF